MTRFTPTQMRSQVVRGTITRVRDEGGYQHADASGRADDMYEDIMRAQPFGFSSNPPVGSEGLLVSLGGNSSNAMMIGAEHQDHRPRNKMPGDSFLYDAHGNIISMITQDIRIVGAQNITLQAASIALNGQVFLGGDHGSGKPAALQGTVDDVGHACVGNLASKVNVV